MENSGRKDAKECSETDTWRRSRASERSAERSSDVPVWEAYRMRARQGVEMVVSVGGEVGLDSDKVIIEGSESWRGELQVLRALSGALRLHIGALQTLCCPATRKLRLARYTDHLSKLIATPGFDHLWCHDRNEDAKSNYYT